MANALALILKDACAEHGDNVAVATDSSILSFRQLWINANRAALQLDELIRPYGENIDRVGLCAANSTNYLVALIAILITDRVPFLIDPQLGPTDLRQISESCGVFVFLADEIPMSSFCTFATSRDKFTSYHFFQCELSSTTTPSLHPTTRLCRFTSGSTGSLKCLEFSASAIIRAATNWATGSTLHHSDRVLCLASFCNGLAFNTSFLANILTGSSIYLMKNTPLSWQVISTLRESRITRLVAFPFAYKALTRPTFLTNKTAILKVAFSAGSTLSPDIRNLFSERFGAPLIDYYGIAETGPCTLEDRFQSIPGLGKPLPGVSIQAGTFQEPAEILVRTESMATRYLNRPHLFESRFDAAGRFKTGDLGYVTDSQLFLCGRLDNTINLEGRKIDPGEIQAVLENMCGLGNVAVSYKNGDEGISAFIVRRSTEVTREEVLHFCRLHLTPFKVPTEINFVSSIPRSSSGKLLMNALRTSSKDIYE